VSESSLYVIYHVATQSGSKPRAVSPALEENPGNIRSLFTNDGQEGLDEEKNAIVEKVLRENQPAEVVGTFIEKPEHKRTNKWPQLERALLAATNSNATLLIVELGTLTANEIFIRLILKSNVNFYCCDQSFVNRTNLEALFRHVQAQRTIHSYLICKGLKNTSAKSGNPNAAEVISKVNKPKIDTAIIFAFLLLPIITDYRKKGYSQRQMVKSLNEEGFTAPEGGKWVLSQLQKVLDRVKLNDLAIEAEGIVSEMVAKELNFEQIAQELNEKSIAPIKKGNWDEKQVGKLIERINQIKEIILINKFVLHLVPIMQHYRKSGLTEAEMLQEFAQAGLPIQTAVEAA